MDALVYTLIFNTTPVAFGALGTPVITLATLTGLPVLSLSAMMGRQLPLISLFLPAYALLFYAGPRAGLIECWPVALVAGLSFAITQAIFANLVGPELPDLIAGLISLLSVIAFVQFWKPPYRSEYEANIDFSLKDDHTQVEKKEKQDTSSSIEEDESSHNKDGKYILEKIEHSYHHHHDIMNSGEDTENQLNNNHTAPKVIIDILTWKETLLAWSPWVIIVVVVIM